MVRFTNDEIAEILNEIDPRGKHGSRLHNALLRLTVNVAIEAVAFRTSPYGIVEVLLHQRGSDEPSYPGEWHCPGSFVCPGESKEDVFERLRMVEGIGRVVSYSLVGDLLWKGARGTVYSAIYLVDLDPAPSVKWFPVNALPEPMVEHHRLKIIPTALNACLAMNR